MSTDDCNQNDNDNTERYSQMATDKLFELAKKNDKEAKEALSYRVHAIILRETQQLLGAKLRQELQSCDIAQSVWMKFDAGLDKFTFNTENALRAYLNRLTHNHIRDKAGHFNAGKRDTSREGGEVNDLQGNTPTPSMNAMGNERLAKYEHCISQLPDQQQYVYEAVAVQGRPYAELANELEKDMQTLYKSFSDAKANLEKCLARGKQNA